MVSSHYMMVDPARIRPWNPSVSTAFRATRDFKANHPLGRGRPTPSGSMESHSRATYDRFCMVSIAKNFGIIILLGSNGNRFESQGL